MFVSGSGVRILAITSTLALGFVAVLLAGAAQGRSAANEWTGTWSTNFGTLTLKQSGSAVTGTYTHDDGRVVGNVSGRVLKGRWTEAPTRTGHDAGPFEFTMSADLASFEGLWNYDTDTGPLTGHWNGTRTSPIPTAKPATTTTSKPKPTPTTTTKKAFTRQQAAYALMVNYMTQYDKTRFSISGKVAIGDLKLYRRTLFSVRLRIDPKAKDPNYDPKTKTLTLLKDPLTIKPGDIVAGETVWHEVTHALEDKHGDSDLVHTKLTKADQDDYDERNVEYIRDIVKLALPQLAEMERRAKAGASVPEIRQAWKYFLHGLAVANDNPIFRKYPHLTLHQLRAWFGYNVNPNAIRNFYRSGKALPGQAGINLRKAVGP